MIPSPASLISLFGRRTRLVLAGVVGLFSGALLSNAALVLYHPQGGPMEYNELGAVLTDGGFVTELSFDFEVTQALRIQKIKAWINGGPESTATFGVTPIPLEEWSTVFSRTFSVEQVMDAPAKWQGVGSLKWDLQPGTYRFSMEAPDVPLGYGYYGPLPNLSSLLESYNYKDYSVPGNAAWAPFGFEVYGSFAPVPEPSFYGLMGAAGLMTLVATRRFRRKNLQRT